MPNTTPFTDVELQAMTDDEIRYYALVDRINLDEIDGKQNCINEFRRMSQQIADAGHTSKYLQDTSRYEAGKADGIARIRSRRGA